MIDPKFARTIDALFEYALDFEARIEKEMEIDVADERETLINAIQAAKTTIPDEREWGLAIYAFCSWVDGLIEDSQWTEKAWWYENCLERQFFGSRVAFDVFFEKAGIARELPNKDPLEVYFLAVALGFQGLYTNSGRAKDFSRGQPMPESITSWAKDVARICPKQGLLKLPAQREIPRNDHPIEGLKSLRVATMVTTLLAVVVVFLSILLSIK
jgi:type IV/VI secretion system ImpK/VasF family protein